MGEVPSEMVERVAQAIENAWQSASTLPPIVFSESESAILAGAAIAALSTSTLQDRVENLERENAALRGVLKPFAKAGELAGEKCMAYGIVSDFYVYRPAAGDEYAIYGDHLRAARAVLAAHPSRGQEAQHDCPGGLDGGWCRECLPPQPDNPYDEGEDD